MKRTNLFDVVELTVDLPDENLLHGARGTIVECYADGAYEVEFTDEDGQTLALCPVSSEQISIVHQANTADRRQVLQKLLTVVNSLDKRQTEEVLDFANSLRQHHAAAS